MKPQKKNSLVVGERQNLICASPSSPIKPRLQTRRPRAPRREVTSQTRVQKHPQSSMLCGCFCLFQVEPLIACDEFILDPNIAPLDWPGFESLNFNLDA